jgi:Ankyrin repeats (3 copies)
MSDFLKCECPHCGQSIEYPSEGTGQTVPCPTCEKLITLTITIQKQVKEDLQINVERNDWGALNERQSQAIQIPAKDSMQKTEMVSIPATETASIVFKRVCSDKEPKLPKYLHYPPEPRPQDYNSDSDYDYVAENKKWVREVKKMAAINRQLFVVHRAKFRLWNAKHKWGDDAWLPSSFPKSPLAPSDSEEVELQKALLENISLLMDTLPISGLERGGSKLSKLTEETIRVKTSAGNTPLHLAAKKGQIDLIPSHLLKVEMFMDRNKDGNTPLHIAAANGALNQVPRQFLTKETLTVSNGTWITGSGYQAHGDTVLHTAAINGHFDQIPKEFMTIEFLKIEATGYRNTVLQYLHLSNGLDVIPGIYTNSALLDYKNSRGWTLRQEIEAKREREAYVARVRNEPATEKQKEKLRWFGCTFSGGITKGQASDALDKCVRDFPEKESAYYSRPATEDQLAQIRQFNKESQCVDGEPYYDFDDAWPLTYGKAKDLIQEWGWAQRQREREEDE